MYQNPFNCSWFNVLGIVLAAAVAAGCQSKLFSYEGTVATQHENVYLKPSGPHSGLWQTDDVIVDYTYRNEANRFQIEGIAKLAPRLTKSFNLVKDLSIQANLLDADTKIQKSVVIIVVGASPIVPWQFNESVAAPPGITAMNFSYAGSVREGSSPNGDIDSTFWKVP